MIIYARGKPLGSKPFLHPFAVAHAYYIRNRTRLFERNGVKKTRYEWSTGEVPDISKMCYWGCPGYVKMPVELRKNKQDDKCFIGYFMGYDSNTKGTLVYVPGQKKMWSTGDFIFDE
jgi:hypothetical protein